MDFFNPHIRGGSQRKRRLSVQSDEAGDGDRDDREEPRGYTRIVPLCFKESGRADIVTVSSSLTPVVFERGRVREVFSPTGASFWSRNRAITAPDPAPSTLRFHVYDLVETVYHAGRCDEVPCRFQGDIVPSGTVIKLLGRTETGSRVCVNVFRQRVYFYVRCEDRASLVSVLRDALGTTRDKSCDFQLDRVQKRILASYDVSLHDVYRVTLGSSAGLHAVAGRLRAAGLELFESNVDAVTRFVLDHNFGTFGWYVAAGALLRPTAFRDAWTDLEYDCAVTDLTFEPESAEWPPYGVLSFDIECIGSEGFPKATVDRDMIIQISCVLWRTGGGDYRRLLLSVGTCSALEGIEVLEFPSELDLLYAFFALLRDGDVEFVTGYNISNFDFQYVLDRAVHVYNLNPIDYCRVKTGGRFEVTRPVDFGGGFARSVAKVKIAGLVAVDMYTVCKDKMSLSDYKLNTVAAKCLGSAKDDVSYKEIPELFREGPRGRARVGRYCVVDAVIVMDLLRHFMTHVEIAEIAKLSRIPVRRILCDGQQIRIFSCLLDVATRENYILPVPPKSASDGYQGATVIDPTPGFYNVPVLVVDFASLYPSIIQAHNLCYSTLVRSEDLHKHPQLSPVDYETFPLPGGAVHFVKPHVATSLLSRLLTAWLQKRREIRSRLADCRDANLRVILDKQQLAIKVTCNSVYGFTGVATGLLPCLKIAETVTFVGRRMLSASMDLVNSLTMERLERIHGAPLPREPDANLRVIYGDTDSLFVLCRGFTADAVLSFCEGLAAHVTATLFKPPIKLEAEKVFQCLMLLTKKRYIGMLSDGKVLMKGVDLIRKTACRFIQGRCRSILDLVLQDSEVKQAAQEISRLGADGVLSRGLPGGFHKIMAILSDSLCRLRAGDVPFSELTFSTELSRPIAVYKTLTLPHLVVYQKMIARGEEPPQLHDRIPYVFVADRGGEKLSDLAEDPAHAARAGLRPAAGLYFDKLIHAVANIVQCLFDNDAALTVATLYNFLPIPPDFNKNR